MILTVLKVLVPETAMKRLLLAFSCMLCVSCIGIYIGGTPGHTALCNDGTYSDSKSCSEACTSHGGVKQWYVHCGSSTSAVSLAFVSSDSNDRIAGAWIGSWTNRKDNMDGTVRLNITENAITGAFVNNDDTLNSLLHGHVDNNGNVSFCVDMQQTPFENAIEYPADIALNNRDAKLAGTITIQIKGTEEIREVELVKE
jgi:hypothetical protein